MLVLGIYIGTLAPEALKDLAPAQGAPQIPVEVARVDEAPQPTAEANPHLTPEISDRIKKLQDLAVKNPENAHTWSELGNLYFDIHDYHAAISAYETSLKFEPGNPDVLTDLGIMYRDTEQFEKALTCFKKAYAINPEHQNAMYNEGIVYATDLHNNRAAIEAWTRLLRINPNAHAPDGVPVSEMIKKLQR